ncbi:hypothetical protein PAMP_018764 [Pampus punctatissimus]
MVHEGGHLWPNVCAEQEMSVLGARQPCVQAFTRMVKVWKQGCTSHRWCIGFERRTAYFTTYRQTYNMDLRTVYKCCPGWTQRGEELGCPYNKHLSDQHSCMWYLQGCVVPIHVSMEGDVQRVEIIYACVQRVSKGQDANTMAFVINPNAQQMNWGRNSNLNANMRQVKTAISPVLYELVCLLVLGDSKVLFTDVNECEVDKGGCEVYCCNTIGSYYCKCPEGSRLGPDGKACHDVNECKELNGGCQQTCVNTPGSYHCECSEGFRMHADGRTCIAVNSCSVLNGGCEHKCVDMGNGHYKCVCRKNYQLKRDGRHCELKDPCKESNGGCAQLCRSEGGYVQCSCRQGFTLAGDDKNCDDIDECSSGHARCSHGCVNMVGSFSCVCHPGFELGADGKQCYRIEMEIINSCEKDNGGCSHHCEHTTNGSLCSCNHGYQLDQDRKTCVDSDECFSGEACCSNICRNYPGGYECSCRAGLSLNQDGCGCDVCLNNLFGDDCNLSCEDCLNGVCSENRERCECSPGWTGVICNEKQKSTGGINLSATGTRPGPTARAQPEAKDVHYLVRKQGSIVPIQLHD